MTKTKRFFASLLSAATLFSFFTQIPVEASQTSNVVINEIAWMGTSYEANDEWIELYNVGDETLDLSGWFIEDDGATKYTISSGTIAPHRYFLIEDNEDAVLSVLSDAVINMSLSNSGDSLVLKNVQGIVIDAVNTSGGAWFSGNNTTKHTMERIDPFGLGDDSENWASNTLSNGEEARDSTLIEGTPDSMNSVAQMSEDITQVTLTLSDAFAKQGDTISMSAQVNDVENLFSYGFNISYDPNVLEYQSSQVGSFLSQNQSVATSFQAGLEDDTEGHLIIAEARTNENQQGINGSGVLFSATFLVIGEIDEFSLLNFDTDSFLSDPDNDIVARLYGTTFTVPSDSSSSVSPVRNLSASIGATRYTLKLSWDESATSADSYKILRKDSLGNFQEIGVTEDLSFIDDEDIVPTVSYFYQVIALKGDESSEAQEVSASDDRGLIGDNNRSDRIDGRDLENLARHFAQDTENDEFSVLIDTTYDGRIDGKDLIDMAANWALNYRS